MVEIEYWVARAGEGVVLKAPDGEVTGSVQVRLIFPAREFPAVGTPLKTLGVVTAEQKFDVVSGGPSAPVEIDVADQAARVILQGIFDHGVAAEEFGNSLTIGAGIDTSVGQVRSVALGDFIHGQVGSRDVGDSTGDRIGNHAVGDTTGGRVGSHAVGDTTGGRVGSQAVGGSRSGRILAVDSDVDWIDAEVDLEGRTHQKLHTFGEEN